MVWVVGIGPSYAMVTVSFLCITNTSSDITRIIVDTRRQWETPYGLGGLSADPQHDPGPAPDDAAKGQGSVSYDMPDDKHHET